MNYKKTISGEDAFQVLAHSFSLSPSEGGYTLQYSANCEDWTSYPDAVPSGENLIVNGIAKGMYFRCLNNTSDLTLVY